MPLSSLLYQGRPLARDSVALTFDDGFLDVFTEGLPILRRYRAPATVFVVARTLAGDTAVTWVDDPPHGVPLEVLSLDAMREMRSAGVEFGSHTFSHPDLTQIDHSSLQREMRDSKELLEDALGAPVRTLAYPRGRHNAVVRQAAEEAGYDFALSLPEGKESTGKYAVPRIGIYAGNGSAALRLKTEPLYLRLRMAPGAAVARRALGRPRDRLRSSVSAGRQAP